MLEIYAYRLLIIQSSANILSRSILALLTCFLLRLALLVMLTLIAGFFISTFFLLLISTYSSSSFIIS